MTKYKLTYFDIDGGRGEPVRIAFHAAGIEFDDNRVSFPDFMEIREGLRVVSAFAEQRLQISSTSPIYFSFKRSAKKAPSCSAHHEFDASLSLNQISRIFAFSLANQFFLNSGLRAETETRSPPRITTWSCRLRFGVPGIRVPLFVRPRF